MSVYVDDMYMFPMGRHRGMKMSHMIADEEAELHAMAERIGVARRWYQGDHYDVSMGCRRQAVGFGAIEIEMRQLATMARNRRHGLGLGRPETAEPLARLHRELSHRLEGEDLLRAGLRSGQALAALANRHGRFDHGIKENPVLWQEWPNAVVDHWLRLGVETPILPILTEVLERILPPPIDPEASEAGCPTTAGGPGRP